MTKTETREQALYNALYNVVESACKDGNWRGNPYSFTVITDAILVLTNGKSKYNWRKSSE